MQLSHLAPQRCAHRIPSNAITRQASSLAPSTNTYYRENKNAMESALSEAVSGRPLRAVAHSKATACSCDTSGAAASRTSQAKAADAVADFGDDIARFGGGKLPIQQQQQQQHVRNSPHGA